MVKVIQLLCDSMFLLQLFHSISLKTNVPPPCSQCPSLTPSPYSIRHEHRSVDGRQNRFTRLIAEKLLAAIANSSRRTCTAGKPFNLPINLANWSYRFPRPRNHLGAANSMLGRRLGTMSKIDLFSNFRYQIKRYEENVITYKIRKSVTWTLNERRKQMNGIY